MLKLIISELRDLIRSLNYVVSIHAAEELDDDNLTILDLENIIFTGTIIKRQRDRQTNEIKCVIHGFTLNDLEAEIVVKIGASGKLVVITIYLV
ncbi:MAG: DUF4258 domain-containing protein [Nitrospirae bacterium]|nr:DUF4258 domain-containing protein [Candidatus Troglogloeales bacterium]